VTDPDSNKTADWTAPTAWSMAVFAAKARAHQARRGLIDLIAGPPTLVRVTSTDLAVLLAESRTPLRTDVRPEERPYQNGKVENLRQAARRLNDLAIPDGKLFSFWRQVGPASTARGFVVGRMLQQGCMVASVGGGLCQLSNALYRVARDGGCGIVERHAHSRTVPGSAAEAGRDATVAWNYVDLRFRPRQDVRLEVGIDREFLVVRLFGSSAASATGAQAAVETAPPLARTCATCDEVDCVRHETEAEA
jgi:vancomycin resistance protein YoaR